MSPITQKPTVSIWTIAMEQPRRFLPFLMMLVLATSCSKDDENSSENQLPIFGTCQAVPITGKLQVISVDGAQTYKYLTNGGGTILINFTQNIKLFHANYENFKIEFWGLVLNGNPVMAGTNENLNGKHIKQWIGWRRSIIFPDNTKLTMATASDFRGLLWVSIVEGNEYHHINAVCNQVEYSSANSEIAERLDDREPDGETGSFEISSTGLKFFNLYTEETAGVRTGTRYELGEIFRDNPTLVNDYFDDPFFTHTRQNNTLNIPPSQRK